MTKCNYCRGCNFDMPKLPYTCNKCKEQLKNLSTETVDWLLRIIDTKIEEAIDNHAEKYCHESAHYGYY